jgi:carbamoyl-phosphate synthase large subunit
MQLLKDNNFPCPYSLLYNASTPREELLKGFNYPFVVKKSSDCGSKHLHIIENLQKFENIPDLDESYILQEYIPGTEYTNAVYKDSFSNAIYVITLERTMKDGMSDEVKVVFNKEIEELCKKVAKKLNLIGSINIQLRKQDNSEPIIFEINPRYSSTAFMRAKFGFNDVIYAFENIVLKKAITPPSIKAGEAYRYITEYYKFY